MSTVRGAHRWLGFIHAMYGLGLLVAPFVATAIASNTPGSGWALFYLFPLGLSILNLSSVVLAFWDSVNMVRRDRDVDTASQERGRNKSAWKEVKDLLGLRDVWVVSLFFFFYLGVTTTSGGKQSTAICLHASLEQLLIKIGWVVEYLVQVRHGNLANIGYVPAGSYGGLVLGRLVLTEPTHRYGERRMLLLYAFICLGLQLVFWLVPNLISSIAVFSIMGFFLGPYFAAVSPSRRACTTVRVLINRVGYFCWIQNFPQACTARCPRSAPTYQFYNLNMLMVTGLVFVVAQAGGAIFPSLIGLVAARAGVQVLPPIVAALIVVMGVAWAFVPKPPSHQE